ncbi:hypothetical protein D3C71_1666780 [compost metagenome]
MFSKPSSDTLATNIAGLAVMSENCLTSGRSSLLNSSARTGMFSFSEAWHFSSSATSLMESLSPERAVLVWRCNAFSTVAISARHSSVWMTSMSEIGSTLPATWITLSSSKQRTTFTVASVSRMWARNLLPRPSPVLAPATRPAMSTNSTMAGTMRSGVMMSASCCRRGSGTSTTPVLGSMVQNG